MIFSLKSFYCSREELRISIDELGRRLSKVELDKILLKARVNLAAKKKRVIPIKSVNELSIAKNPYDLSMYDLELPQPTMRWLLDYKTRVGTQSGFKRSFWQIFGDPTMLSGILNISARYLPAYPHQCWDKEDQMHLDEIRKVLKELDIDVTFD